MQRQARRFQKKLAPRLGFGTMQYARQHLRQLGIGLLRQSLGRNVTDPRGQDEVRSGRSLREHLPAFVAVQVIPQRPAQRDANVAVQVWTVQRQKQLYASSLRSSPHSRTTSLATVTFERHCLQNRHRLRNRHLEQCFAQSINPQTAPAGLPDRPEVWARPAPHRAAKASAPLARSPQAACRHTARSAIRPTYTPSCTAFPSPTGWLVCRGHRLHTVRPSVGKQNLLLVAPAIETVMERQHQRVLPVAKRPRTTSPARYGVKDPVAACADTSTPSEHK